MRVPPCRQERNISQWDHQNWMETEWTAWVVFQTREFKAVHPFSSHSQQEESEHEPVRLKGALRVKEGNSHLPTFKKPLGWNCEGNDLELVTTGLVCAPVHIYFSNEQALQELLGLGDMYRSTGKSKGSARGKRKWLCPLPLCQVPELKYMLSSNCSTLWSTL